MTEKDRYKAACDYKTPANPAQVEKHLHEYLAALGIKRDIVQIRRGWRVEDYPALLGLVTEIARDASDARDALAARDASAARAARDALDARAARDASDALAARAASDASDARDALAASDARAARAARAARDASDALAARAARDARDALAARDALDARAASDARDAIQRFAAWCIFRPAYYSWDWECSWLATTHIGALQSQATDVKRWSKPVFEAFCSGCWLLCWTDSTLYWVAHPTVNVEQIQGRRLHRNDGPACENDVEDIYFWHGVMVPEKAIMSPAEITCDDIADEENAEVRRILIERLGGNLFLERANAKQIDVDMHEHNGMRALFRTEIREPQAWLVCACPSTARVYYMEVPPDTASCEAADRYLRGPALEKARIVGAT